MKLLVTIALACTLFSKVHPLTCNECISTTPDEDCSQIQTSKTCLASQTKCASTREEVTVGTTNFGTTTTHAYVMSCVAPSQCVSVSVNVGITRRIANTKCCDTDLCNKQDASALPASNLNGRKCFTCVGNNCSSTLECKGPEDRCMKITESVGERTITVKGCASQSFCSGGVNTELGKTVVDLNCCEGNMCNNALRIGQSILFLLLVPLASFMLFH